jgi:hypothetical protein
MAQDSRIVGKHVLESLTTGMYADNQIIFREYIQNSSDAIDEAVTKGIFQDRQEGKIHITLDRERREIRIRDNGIGIPSERVFHGLGDIGNSAKNYAENRGFRGIGRLGGLGYCQELQFITSYQGEPCKTITFWDCRELKRLLQPSVKEYSTAIEVIDAVTVLDKKPESIDEHYFEVVLTGIEDGHDNLLDFENIRDYLSQVAPVPFNYQNLSILDKVNAKLRELGKEPEEFNIYLGNEQIYKAYKRSFLVDVKKNKKEGILDIEFFEGKNGNGDLFFLGWYGRTELGGVIKEDNVSGLRVRKKNILIGNNRTLDAFFGNNPTYQAFNRWFIGEIYVFDNDLLPNSRRDNFEENDTYFRFKREVEKTTKEKLAKLPHKYSTARTTERTVQDLSQTIQNITTELQSGNITETRQEQLLQQLEDCERKQSKIKPAAYTKLSPDPASPDDSLKKQEEKSEEVQKTKAKLQKQIEKLKQQVQEVDKKNVSRLLPSQLPRKSREIVEKIFNIIDRTLDEGLAKELKAQIIEELKQKSKESE